MSNHEDYVVLSAGETALVVETPIGDRPVIVYWGIQLDAASPAQLKHLSTRQHASGSASMEVPISLMNEVGAGGLGAPGILMHRSGAHWASLFEITRIDQASNEAAAIISEDTRAAVRLTHHLTIDPASEIIRVETIVENFGANDLSIDWCTPAVLPLPERAKRLVGFSGRWAGEFQTEEIPAFTGTYLRENRAGRTSHDGFPGLLATGLNTTEQHGECYGFHFGWSGNSRIRADRLADGRAAVQMGEYFYPGECVLSPGEIYKTPPLYAGFATGGLSRLSQKFHDHVRSQVLDGRAAQKLRPVHYNTWEAVYFDHDLETLRQLATAAADVGVERFILDDGWFGARRSDAAGLGDWHVSTELYPEGLAPLVTHVNKLGMEFGLWFEPEMVNPDSDLFRAHPDWVLQVDGVPQIKSRNQYVLDLTRPEVSSYLFQSMSAILAAHNIAYFKWDMNRDIHHPGSGGRPVASAQTRAVYALMDRVRAAFPSLAIESCSSGGARADYGVLKRTDRIWTSDSNDALDRQIIQRGASHFFPLEVMGAHVGPAACHITGRRLSMQLRVATALFGHMGLELNLLEEDPSDLEVLKAGIDLYKTHRTLLHSGDLQRLETPEYAAAIGVVSKDRCEALFSWCQLTGHRETLPGRLCFVGLDPARTYRLQIVWPDPVRAVSRPSVIEALDLTGGGAMISGEALMTAGLQIPLMYPETCILYHLTT